MINQIYSSVAGNKQCFLFIFAKNKSNVEHEDEGFVRSYVTKELSNASFNMHVMR